MASHTKTKNIFNTIAQGSDHESDNEYVTRSTTPVQDEQETKEQVRVTIVPFEGREVVELKKFDDKDYPVLDAFPNAKKENTKHKKTNVACKPTVTRFIVGSSYESERHQNTQRHNFNPVDPRSQSFAKMGDRDAVNKTLTCTRACNNVKRASPEDDYGVCYRNTCTFAHSLDQLNDPMCGFDATCRFRWGKPRRDGSVDSTTKCMFRHSDEMREDWTKRTERPIPDLPETSENTHKPAVHKPAVHKTQVFAKPQRSTPARKVNLSVCENKFETPVVRPSTPLPFITRKVPVSHWGTKPQIDSSTSKPVLVKHLDYSDSSDSSDACCSKSYRGRSRRRSRSPHDYCISHKTEHVIRVPTKELAEIAINAAFDRGVYNLQVIVG
jgi:hypothetical protein